MDIYGYPDYQYYQSKELAKQMFAHQTFSSPYNRAMQEPHSMPEPSGAPWNIQGLSWGMNSPPQLVQFTGQPNVMDSNFTPVIHCKRKSVDVEPVIPTKQFITEEKMAAHLSGLHISSEYTPHTLASSSPEVMEVNMDPATASVCEKLKGHTIVLSEELKKLQNEPLLPPSLIERLEKPCLSLVVWKPKDEIINKLRQAEDEEECKRLEEEQPAKRNSVLVPEFTGMDVEM